MMVPRRLILGYLGFKFSLWMGGSTWYLAQACRRLFHNTPNAGTECSCSGGGDTEPQSRGQCVVLSKSIQEVDLP